MLDVKDLSVAYGGLRALSHVTLSVPEGRFVTLVEPVGNLSASELLWTFIGASTPYQMFTGWAEAVAGVLLVIPRTAIVGAAPVPHAIADEVRHAYADLGEPAVAVRSSAT